VRHRRYMKARTSAPNPTFAHTGAADVKSCIIRGKRVQELQIDKRHWNHGLAAAPSRLKVRVSGAAVRHEL